MQQNIFFIKLNQILLYMEKNVYTVQQIVLQDKNDTFNLERKLQQAAVSLQIVIIHGFQGIGSLSLLTS